LLLACCLRNQQVQEAVKKIEGLTSTARFDSERIAHETPQLGTRFEADRGLNWRMSERALRRRMASCV
jgi:hypothetical protein